MRSEPSTTNSLIGATSAIFTVVKAVLLGPLSFLWLGKGKQAGFDRFSLLDPVRQADRFLSVVESRWKTAPKPDGGPGVLLVLDFEKNGHYPGGTMRVDQAVAFINRIHQRTGKYPGVYSGEFRIRDVINGSGTSAAAKNALTKCWLWVANYHYEPRITTPWRAWDLWQYTGDGVCEGGRVTD